jgi:outer membrane protein
LTDAAEFLMEYGVTLQYMVALRARDRVDVARRQVDSSLENLEIVQARVDAQAAIVMDAAAAQVQVGRDSVALLQAESAMRVETLRLLETVGLDLGADVELVSQFEVFRPSWTSTELISIALESHPGLTAVVANEGARRANLQQARGQYFPSLTLTGGWSGFTQEVANGDFLVANAERGAVGALASCQTFNNISAGLTTPLEGFPQQCGSGELSTEARESILTGNRSFPFGFTRQPFSASLRLSIPIFNGFSRERSVSQASNQLEDAVYSRRAEELQIRTSVTSALDALMTAFSVVQVEERSREVAAEQLEMSRTRYGLGADNFIVLLDAERTMAEGERAHLDSLYSFYAGLANLENAVGQQLRPEE